MGEAEEILRPARSRVAHREAARVPVDYRAMEKMVPRQRAALTRAVKSGDPDRVVVACRDAVREWNEVGMHWPDDWSRWQSALDAALPWHGRVELGDLA